MRTNGSPRLTLIQGGGGEEKSGSALSCYGPMRAGLTTSQRTQSQALSESLNDLESGVQTLESRYLEVCATLNIVMSDLVKRGLFGVKINTTDVVE